MASAVAMTTVPVPPVSRQATITGSDAFICPMKLRVGAPRTRLCPPASRLSVQASSSMKENAVGGLTAVALVAALVIPEVAEAAQPGVSSSLKNFLLSIVAGGVVLGVITGAVIGVSNFDPVKRS